MNYMSNADFYKAMYRDERRMNERLMTALRYIISDADTVKEAKQIANAVLGGEVESSTTQVDPTQFIGGTK